MIECDAQISNQCVQLKNMIQFLMISIKENDKLTHDDIYEFLKRTHQISAHICKNFNK